MPPAGRWSPSATHHSDRLAFALLLLAVLARSQRACAASRTFTRSSQTTTGGGAFSRPPPALLRNLAPGPPAPTSTSTSTIPPLALPPSLARAAHARRGAFIGLLRSGQRQLRMMQSDAGTCRILGLSTAMDRQIGLKSQHHHATAGGKGPGGPRHTNRLIKEKSPYLLQV